MIYLAFGSNLGNRFENFRKGLKLLSEFFDCKIMSHIIETEALLLEGSPESWNIPYLNMVVGGETRLDPFELLARLKSIEQQVGRDLSAPVWSPRILDLDIVFYHDEVVNTDRLKIPHVGVRDRDFLQFLLREVGCEKIPPEMLLNIENYKPLNHYVLDPKLVGIVNVTPDSFSDGGKFSEAVAAENRVHELQSQGAYVIELGAQSTRPGYIEVSPNEEISRLQSILENCRDVDCFGIDSYFDDVVQFALKYQNVRWINDQRAQLSRETIKKIADANVKLVTMLHGTDFSWFRERISQLQNFGMACENIVIDPGIGFGKTKSENITILKNIDKLKEYGCEIMVGHSRKSFMEKFSSEKAENRDIETLAISYFLDDHGVDYLRVHNIRDHMRIFCAKKILTLSRS